MKVTSKSHSFPFPSSILHLILLTIVAAFVTALFMIVIPMENINFFDNAFDNHWVSDSIIIYVFLFVMLGVSYLINSFRKQKLPLFRQDCSYDWKLCALVLFAIILAHYVLIVPFNSIFWGALDAHTHKSFWFIITALLVTPIFEEILFRGVFLNGLSARYSSPVAILITAIVFSLFHFDYHLFWGAFLMGIFLSLLYLKSNGNLLFCIICHILANTLSYVGCYNLALYRNRTFAIILFVVGLCISFSIFFTLYHHNKKRHREQEKRIPESKIDLVTVATYDNQMSAEIAKEMLIASGIDAITDGTVSFYPDFNYTYPIHIKVRREDVSAASEVLSKDKP